MVKADLALRELVAAIMKGDDGLALRLLTASPSLARVSFHSGATRQTARAFYLALIGRYIWAGDTALHIAAAAYQTEMVRMLLSSGADVHAKNRLGDEALHAAAVGQPGSPMWNPTAQTATIVCLIEAGANPNTINKTGVSPLHRAIRSRCAAACELSWNTALIPNSGIRAAPRQCFLRLITQDEVEQARLRPSGNSKR